MATRPDTWMPLYWGDYLKNTMHLRAEGHGAYLLLIAHYWTTGQPLPDDDDYLIAVCRVEIKAWQKLKPILAKFFEVADGVWTHARVEEELAKASQISKARQKAGQRGGRASAKRRAKAPPNDQANSKQLVQQTGKQNPTPSQSPSPVHSTATTTETVSAHASSGPNADAALGLIEVFDRTLTAAWGENRARPWPAGSDLAKARDWLASGVTPEDLTVLLGSRMHRMAADGKEPPKSLAYFDQAVRELLKSGKVLPEAVSSMGTASLGSLPPELSLEEDNRRRAILGQSPRRVDGSIDWDAEAPDADSQQVSDDVGFLNGEAAR